MADSAIHEWRKHPYVLITSIGEQLAQVFLALIFLLIGFPLLRTRLGLTLPPSVSWGILTVLFCLWTVLHLGRSRPARSNGGAELAGRQEVITHFSGPVRRMMAFLLMGVAGSIIVFALADAGAWLWLPIAGYYVLLAIWLSVEIRDWWNDKYILTEDRIIDIMRLPIVYEKYTEAPLAMVQNATTSQRGIGTILNFGNVQVETAGKTQTIVFESVSRPREIQEEIFQHIDALRKAERERERAALATQAQRWIEAYHTLTGGIRDVKYTGVALPSQPIQIRWNVQGAAGKSYRTWIAWDTISRLDGGEYAGHIRAEGKPWYEDDYEYDGIGVGIHHVRGFKAPSGFQNLYFRITVWFEGNEPVQSSPEMSIIIREPSRV